MSAPSELEILEEEAGNLGVSVDDMCRLWLSNAIAGRDIIMVRLNELFERAKENQWINFDNPDEVLTPWKTRSDMLLDLLEDVVDIWLENFDTIKTKKPKPKKSKPKKS